MSEIQAWIANEVKTNDVVLFMKGTPTFPQCGFSSTYHGNNLTMEQQAAKLRLCVETAGEVWGGV